ncbi:MAG: hypothetical protein ACLP19_18050 [Xanthobacteraceae bacterium]
MFAKAIKHRPWIRLTIRQLARVLGDRIEDTPGALVDSLVSCQPAHPQVKEKEMQVEIEYCGM